VLKCSVFGKGDKAPARPWEGADTLEWTHLPSPPPYHSFHEQPEVK
jgi:cytochrome c oxidase subunit I